jgi:hypothetical protein
VTQGVGPEFKPGKKKKKEYSTIYKWHICIYPLLRVLLSVITEKKTEAEKGNRSSLL